MIVFIWKLVLKLISELPLCGTAATVPHSKTVKSELKNGIFFKFWNIKWNYLQKLHFALHVNYTLEPLTITIPHVLAVELHSSGSEMTES